MTRSTLLDDVGIAPDAELDLLRGRLLKRREDLRAADAFWRIASSGHFRACSCASIGEYGERKGFSASEARMLAGAGQAVSLLPSLRDLVLEGRMTLEGASILARVLRDPGVQGAESIDTWVSWAREESALRFRIRVNSRLRELETQQKVHDVVLHLTDGEQEDLDRSRVLLGNRARRNFTESEAVATLSVYFLDREDPQRREPGTRRVGSTTENRSRHVPTDAKRLVHFRSGNRCEVPLCDITHGLELAHIVAHQDGGGREATDLFEGCRFHHQAYDAGWLHAEMVDGRPEFSLDGVGHGFLRGGFGREEPGGRKWPLPPHLRPNPLSSMVDESTWNRPPPS